MGVPIAMQGRHIARRRWRPWLVLVLAACVCASPVRALEVAGIQVPDRATVGGRELALNGAGLRSRFFVRIYVGALYLTAPASDADAAIAMPGPKRVAMHIVHDALSREQITDAWRDGLSANHPQPVMAALGPRIDAFNALWPALAGGDVVAIDYDDTAGTTVTINGARRGQVPGKDFNDALLRIWLGDDPVDGDVKRGMLGG